MFRAITRVVMVFIYAVLGLAVGVTALKMGGIQGTQLWVTAAIITAISALFGWQRKH